MSAPELDDDLIAKVADFVKRGVMPTTAARAHGLMEPEYRELIAEGIDHVDAGLDTQPAKLARAIDKARAEFEASQTMLLTKAAIGYRRQDGSHQEGDFRAAQAALAATHNAESAEQIRELTREPGGAA